MSDLKNVTIGPIVYGATGRRKRAVARVRLVPGDGRIFVNNKPADEHFVRKTHMMQVQDPLGVTDTLSKFNILARLHGGGISGKRAPCATASREPWSDLTKSFAQPYEKAASSLVTHEKKNAKSTAGREHVLASSGPSVNLLSIEKASA